MKDQILSTIASITILRHGNAAKAAEGQADSTRALTEKGARQAKALGQALEGYEMDFVLSSPYLRAEDTVNIVTGVIPITLDILGIDENPENPLNVMFKDLAYSPLIGDQGKMGYYEHALGSYLKTWARASVEAIIRNVQSSKIDALHLVVGNHAVMSNALIDEICKALGHSSPECVTHYNLGEAQALRLTITDGIPTVELIAPQVPEPVAQTKTAVTA